MADLIKPERLKGFRDYLPQLMIPREELLERARRVYRSYGFAPIDTPALEKLEILSGKAGEDSAKLIYAFKDHGDRDVALRFDLTVPFARFSAEHIAELGTPFKRYHMGPVWRGENTGHGRFREFWQCDFDTIGTESNATDIETALVIVDLMHALGFERFEVHINNRLVLNGLLEEIGLAGQTEPVLRALDKLPKIGKEKVIAEMRDKAGVTSEQAERVLSLVEMQGTNQEVLDRVEREFGGGKVKEGTSRLRELLSVCADAGVPAGRLLLDLSIARGLDYYTGTIYETFLQDKPDIGSVCSGGRYDNLAGLYTRQRLPGVGASLGLDRLLEAMKEMDLLPKTATPAPVLVVQFEPRFLGRYQGMARQFRAAGIGVEVFPEPKKLGPQLKYAEARGFRIALLAGPDDFAQGAWQVKDLLRREQQTVPETGVIEAVRQLLLQG
jgi:histidyl-tRNA synthetase